MKLRYYLRGLAVGILVATLILTVANAGNNRPLSDIEVRRRALELGMVDGESEKLLAQPGRNDGSAAGGSAGSGDEPSGTSSGAGPQDGGLGAGGATAQTGTAEPGAGTQDGGAGSDAGAAEPGAGTQDGGAGSDAGPTEPGAGGVTAQTGTATQTGTAEPGANMQDGGAGSDAGTTEPGAGTVSGLPEPDNTAVQPVTIEIRGGATSYSVSKELAAAGLVEDAAAFDDYLCKNGYARSVRTGTYKILPGTSEEDIAKIIAK